MSFREMEEAVAKAELADPTGLQLNRTTASQIARGVYKGTPESGTIRAIALVAGVPEHVAFAAVGQRVTGTPFRDELPDGVDQLEPRERRAALDLLRVLIAQRQELNRHADTPRADHSPPATTEDTPYPPRALEKTKGRIRPPSSPDEERSLLEYYGFTPALLERYNLGDGRWVTGFLMTVHTDALRRGEPDLWATALIPGFEEQFASAGVARNERVGVVTAGWIRKALARVGWVSPTVFHSPRPSALAVSEAERNLRYDPEAATQYIEGLDVLPSSEDAVADDLSISSIQEFVALDVESLAALDDILRANATVVTMSIKRAGRSVEDDVALGDICLRMYAAARRRVESSMRPNSPTLEIARGYFDRLRSRAGALADDLEDLAGGPELPPLNAAETKIYEAAAADADHALRRLLEIDHSRLGHLVPEIDDIASRAREGDELITQLASQAAAKFESSAQAGNLAHHDRKDSNLTKADEYELAARDLGDEPVGRKIRRRQDEAGEMPDPEGPEGGA